MWILYQTNVLAAMATFRFQSDPDGFANFIANEYDSCIKRGGDMIYGVPVMNGNVTGMAKVISKAFKKGRESGEENFNLLQEIYPSAFDAYWLGAEMAPIPNPLLRPGGWPTTPPAPGAVMNIGPNPIALALSVALHKALVEAAKGILDSFKSLTIEIPLPPPAPPLVVNVYETLEKILKKEPVPTEVLNHPAVQAAKEAKKAYDDAKKKKPSIGSQIKKALKFPFPELPKKKEIKEKITAKLIDEAVKQLEEQLTNAIKEQILQPIIQQVEAIIAMADSLPKKPTKAEIKKFVKDIAEGLVPDIDLGGLELPKIPTKQELKDMIKSMLPTKQQLKDMAYDLIKDKIPDIPNIWFVPPTIVFTPPALLFVGPFVNLAKFHLMGVSGTMMVMAQYPPPAPPAPAILQWNGYNVIG